MRKLAASLTVTVASALVTKSPLIAKLANSKVPVPPKTMSMLLVAKSIPKAFKSNPEGRVKVSLPGPPFMNATVSPSTE